MKKKPEEYVNGKEFFIAVSDYVYACRIAAKENKPKPQMNNYLALSIMKIAKKLSNRPNFSGYTYKDEMIADGIENVIKYLDRFKPEKTNNAFAYVTQCLFNSYVRRIKLEQGHSKLKQKLLENLTYMDKLSEKQDDDDTKYHNEYAETLQGYAMQNSRDRDKPVVKIKRKKKS